MFRLTPQAEADLETISDYVSNYNPQAALRLVARLRQACMTLDEFPQLGPARDDIRPGLRVHHVRNYVIVYREIADGVEVVRVFHRARNWPSLL